MASKQEDPIPIDTLPLEQLNEFGKEIEARCEQLGDAIRQLNGALARYDNIREGRQRRWDPRGQLFLSLSSLCALTIGCSAGYGQARQRRARVACAAH